MARSPKDPAAERMSASVERSIASVRKKGMVDAPPFLSSGEPARMDLWAKTLLAQCGPKDKDKSLEEYFMDIPVVIEKLGSHGYKLPIPEVSTPPFFTPLERPSSPGGLLCEALLPQALIYSGDASQIRLAKFLMARLVVDNRETRVLDELRAGPERPVSAALIRAGMPATNCQKVSEAYRRQVAQDISTVPVHPLSKQIFFEEEGCEDILLLPVASEAMIAELHHQAQFPGRWLASRALCAIGGANPVNGGALCSDLGGAFQLLMAEPPAPPDPSLAARLIRGGRVYTRFILREEDVRTFATQAPLQQAPGRLREREREQAAYDWFATVLMAPLIEADDLVAGGLDPVGEQKGIGAYLRRNREEPVSEDLAHAAVAEVFDWVVQPRRALAEHAADATIRRVLIDKMTQELM